MSNTLLKIKRSAVKGKSPTTSNVSLGELALNTNDGRLFFKTTDSSGTSAIATLREISGGTGITATNGVLSLDNQVTAQTVGNATTVPRLTINAQGQITGVTTATVAGVSGFDFDSSNGTLTITTSAGNFSDVLTLDPYTTTDLTEGTNQYHTTARARGAISATGSLSYNSSTGVVSFTERTDQEVRNLFSSAGDLSYDSSTGQFSFSAAAQAVTSVNSLTGAVILSTSDIAEGSRLYYTNSRWDSALATKSTDDLTEGSNQYFTNARARSAVSATNTGTGYGGLSYTSGTGAFSFAKVTDANIRGAISAGTGITYNSGTGVIGTSITQYTSAMADSDARHAISVTDNGGDGSLSYTPATGVIAYTGPSASEVRAHLSGSSGVNYNSSTGAITADQGEIRGLFSASDAGGDGSFSYNSSTGQFTYTGPSASEVQAHITANKGVSISSGQINIDSDNVKGMFSGGTGVTYSDGAISIGQAVGTTNDVQFADVTASGDVVVTGNLTVNGATVTNSATNTTIEDQLIELGTGNTGSASGDAGIVIERGDDDNVFLGWDESTDRVRFATTTATGASSGNLTLTNANVEAGRFYGDLTGDVTGNADTVGNLSASQFLRSDADDTMGGHITMSPGKNIKYQDTGGTFPTNAGKFEWVLNNDYASIHANQPSSDVIDFDFNIRDNAGSTDRFRFWIDDYRGTHKDVWQAIMSGSAAEFMMSSDSSGNRSTARFRIPLSGDVEIDSQKVWHAGNDGASSGLDADKLDGQHGSHYLDYGNFTNTPNITTTAQGAISATTSGTGHGGLTYDNSTGVMTYAKVTDANIRGAVSASGDLSYNSSTGEFSFSETYSTATEILNALKTVDTNTSGLNADTLDGQEGTHYRINVYNASGTLLN